ncbi:uncharacterized protein BO97DRAFT_441292 [Aspergillus homomorphus CBS 101889]|uniref:Uncharacterized protein n=1 Tax=Aspergillus homomorphus (strain CBS 101889) TaxID=1450537 RepID=A0A395I5I6_ASPHC|nr:hypothetical protein BO97DRAFT_441292 [Aspergillus homomorphus CBS 101889]RAL14793.1 hypothetical protein BO97DRAFT_441292 [Aspergillus homomorphus CBS 101889]
MPHHCTVCRTPFKLSCFDRGHITQCPTCEQIYQTAREKSCPYCRNALLKRIARESSQEAEEASSPRSTPGPSAEYSGDEKENASQGAKSKKKKKGKVVRETRRLKDLRR